MDNKEMEKLNQEDLDQVAGGQFVDFTKEKCPKCGKKYNIRVVYGTFGIGGKYWEGTCPGCGNVRQWGDRAPNRQQKIYVSHEEFAKTIEDELNAPIEEN